MSSERLFEPFAGWLIRPEWAARVIAGAYDTKSPAERREIEMQRHCCRCGRPAKAGRCVQSER